MSTSGYDIPGTWLRGQSAEKLDAQMLISKDGFAHIKTESFESEPVLFTALKISPRISNSARYIEFPDDSVFETSENHAVDLVKDMFISPDRYSLIYKLESSLPYLLSALAVLVVIVYLSIVYGLPSVSKKMAYIIPSSAGKSIDSQVMTLLDKSDFKTSKIDEKRKGEVDAIFKRVVTRSGFEKTFFFNLNFRNSVKIGPNAFALPGGSVVITDQLIEISDNNSEIELVLAHEVGHIINRHVIQMILQNSIIALVVVVMAGDISTGVSVVSAIPPILIKNGYSRNFEREADSYLAEYAAKYAIDPALFGTLMHRITGKNNFAENLPSLISTHPPLEERIELIRNTYNLTQKNR